MANSKKITSKQFLKAIEIDDAETARLAIEQGIDVNIIESVVRNTPLHIAALYGYTEMAELLLNNGAKVNALNDEKTTPLHMAMACLPPPDSSRDSLKELIDSLDDSHSFDEDEIEELEIGESDPFLQKNEIPVEIIRLLHTHGSNLNCVNKNGQTPLMAALEHRSYDAVGILAELGADLDYINKEGFSAISLAAQHAPLEVLECLFHHGVNLNPERSKPAKSQEKSPHNPLIGAIQTCKPSNALFLLTNGASITQAINKDMPPAKAADALITLLEKLLEKAHDNRKDGWKTMIKQLEIMKNKSIASFGNHTTPATSVISSTTNLVSTIPNHIGVS